MSFKKYFLPFLSLFFFNISATSYTLHGQEIQDPYAYLEEMESEKTQDWLQEQEANTLAYYHQLSNREALRSKLIEYTPQQSQFPPIRKNGNFFSFHRAKGADKYRLEIKTKDQKNHLLIDPSTFDQKENISLRGQKLNAEGTQFYYALSQSGSDFTTWKLYDLKNQKDSLSEITHSKFFPPIWSEHSEGIFYSRWQKGNFSDPDFNLGIYFHSNSSPSDQRDDLIVKNDNPKKMLFPICMLDDQHLVYSEDQGCSSIVGVKIIHLKTHYIQEIIPEGLAKFIFVQKSNDMLYFFTDYQAKNNKLIGLPLNQLKLDYAEDILLETKHCLEDVVITQDYILGNYTIDCQSKIQIFDRQGKYIRDLNFGHSSTISLSSISPDYDSYQMNEVFFSAYSFLKPSSIYHYQVSENKMDLFFQPETPQNDWVTKQVFFTSKDGTKVPMFICHSKNLILNGKNPTLMWGYGGFGCSMTPYYSPHHSAWLDQGGIFVSVNVRGGLEYGKAWHDGGKLHNKQNVFDDFISAAEYLIQEGYTSPNQLAIHGTSNGGLLVGACITQRPELFKAAVAQVPVMDMLKFHKYTIGSAWISDYGNPDDPKDFEVLYKYSPYHNAHKAKRHPALLVLTADHDDRVVPLHSYKFVARLKEVSDGKAPVILKVNRKQGHGSGGGSIQKMIDLQADILSFLCYELDVQENKSRH